jgi:CMP-N,N'-diacetyllegionaminic acid synthase
MRQRILAIIPARGGSKRLPGKNIKPLGGQPLLLRTVNAARASRLIDRIVVSTDDEAIATVAKKAGVEVIRRPASLARNKTPIIPVLLHVVDLLFKKECYRPEIIVLLQVTSPLRTTEDIDATIRRVIEGADSAETFCTMKDHPYYAFAIDRNENARPLDPKHVTMRSQDLPKLYKENGAVFAMTIGTLRKEGLYGKKHRAVIMPSERSIDIDEPIDFKIAEVLLRER